MFMGIGLKRYVRLWILGKVINDSFGDLGQVKLGYGYRYRLGQVMLGIVMNGNSKSLVQVRLGLVIAIKLGQLRQVSDFLKSDKVGIIQRGL